MADKMMRIAGRDKNGQSKAMRSSENGEVMVRKSGSIEVTTIIEDVTLGPTKFTGNYKVRSEGQSETWVLVSTDQPNWNLTRVNTPYGEGYNGTERSFYPERKNEQKTYLKLKPSRSLVVFPISPSEAEEGYLVPMNILEAKALSDNSELEFFFNNLSTEEATVTIKIMKVWR